MIKSYIKKALPHIVAIAIFLGISIAYFSPALSGYAVSQHDINSHKGMSNEVADHRSEFGEEPLWTNAMFGGMPATQISVVYKSNLLKKVQNSLLLDLPHPVNIMFLFFIGFYIFMMCMKVDPWLAVVASLTYGFSTYFFIIMEQGHNSKAVAMAYMAPALGGFLMAFRRNILMGAGVFTLFVALQIGANHPQVTYYFFILLFLVFIHEVIRMLKASEGKKLAKITGLIALGTGLAILNSIPNLLGTKEYAQYSQRAGSELTPVLTQEELEDENGNAISEEKAQEIIAKKKIQDQKDYKLQWSFTAAETWVFFIPNAKGGGDASLGTNEDFQESDDYPALKQFMSNTGFNQYWGNQTSSAGPVYIGAIVCLLFILGMVFWQNTIKWPLLILTIIAVMLSWGKNLMWFNDLFWNHAPLYSSFRAVTIILVMVELTLPIVGFLWLRDLLKDKEWATRKFSFFGKYPSKFTNKKMMLYISGGIAGLLLLFTVTPKTFFSFVSENEQNIQFNAERYRSLANEQSQNTQFLANNKITAQQLRQYYENNVISKIPGAKTELEDFRSGMFSASALRTLAFVLLALTLIFLYFKYRFDLRYFYVVFGVLMLIDLWPIGKQYLGNEEGSTTDYEQWEPIGEKLIPFMPAPSDLAILKNEMNTNPELAKIINAEVAQLKADKPDVEQREIYRAQFRALNRNTNYRVYDGRILDPKSGRRKSLASSPESSYFHKSLGGYHSAKLQRFQDLLETGLIGSPNVMNMLNVKYIQDNVLGAGKGKFQQVNDPSSVDPTKNPNPAGKINTNRLGNAWFVSEVKGYEGPDEEFKALRTLEPEKEAITDITYEHKAPVGKYTYTNNAKIEMTQYRANEIIYEISNQDGDGDYYAVFSEIYYALGWKAEIDGKSTDLHRVNYTLRGVKVPRGSKTIRLYYDLESFNDTSNLALIASLGVLLFFCVTLYLGRARKET